MSRGSVALELVLFAEDEEARQVIRELGPSSRSTLRVALLRLLQLLNEEDPPEADG